MRKYPINFEHGDSKGETHTVRAFVKEMDDSITFTLNRMLSDSAREAGNYDPDLAQFAVLREAIERLNIDGKNYSLTKSNKGVPRYKDQEINKTVLEHLLGYIIRYNEFLVEEEAYQAAFEEYALDDQVVPQEDPTELRTIG